MCLYKALNKPDHAVAWCTQIIFQTPSSHAMILIFLKYSSYLTKTTIACFHGQKLVHSLNLKEPKCLDSKYSTKSTKTKMGCSMSKNWNNLFIIWLIPTKINKYSSVNFKQLFKTFPNIWIKYYFLIGKPLLAKHILIWSQMVNTFLQISKTY